MSLVWATLFLFFSRDIERERLLPVVRKNLDIVTHQQAIFQNRLHLTTIAIPNNNKYRPIQILYSRIFTNKYSIGVISLNNVLRIAYSAVAANDVSKMFEGIYSACNECLQ